MVMVNRNMVNKNKIANALMVVATCILDIVIIYAWHSILLYPVKPISHIGTVVSTVVIMLFTLIALCFNYLVYDNAIVE